MRVHNLKGLRTLMVVRDISQRRLALAAGYRSHSYMGRILRGEVNTLADEAALRIARFLQVDTEFLFVPSSSSPSPPRQVHRRRPVPPGGPPERCVQRYAATGQPVASAELGRAGGA